MTPISKVAQRTFEQVIANLKLGESQKLDNTPDIYMPLHVECLRHRHYSLAHYFELNGDAVADPDGEFWVGDDRRIYPVALQQCTGHYTVAIEFDDNGQPARVFADASSELADFANQWLLNIQAQQLSIQ